MSILALQNAFVKLAALDPKLAFETLDAEVAMVDERQDGPIIAGSCAEGDDSLIFWQFVLMGPDGRQTEPTKVTVRIESFTGPEYLVADYADGTRIIQLPVDDMALFRTTSGDGETIHGIMDYHNQPGMGYILRGA